MICEQKMGNTESHHNSRESGIATPATMLTRRMERWTDPSRVLSVLARAAKLKREQRELS